MSPPRNLDLVRALQREWHCCMKQGEEEIESQRGVNVTDRQVIPSPGAEKNKCRESRQDLDSREPFFDQCQRQQAEVDDEQVTEQQCWPMRHCLKTKKVKRRQHRDRRETDGARENCGVHFSIALCPCGHG